MLLRSFMVRKKGGRLFFFVWTDIDKTPLRAWATVEVYRFLG
jgi:hypothetical protein